MNCRLLERVYELGGGDKEKIFVAHFLLLGSMFVMSSCNSNEAVGVVSAEINEDGELVLVYSDGNEQNKV